MFQPSGSCCRPTYVTFSSGGVLEVHDTMAALLNYGYSSIRL